MVYRGVKPILQSPKQQEFFIRAVKLTPMSPPRDSLLRFECPESSLRDEHQFCPPAARESGNIALGDQTIGDRIGSYLDDVSWF